MLTPPAAARRVLRRIGVAEAGLLHRFEAQRLEARVAGGGGATGAFCALHKGLDAADTKAYPEAKFGKATRKNLDTTEQFRVGGPGSQR